SFKDNFTTALLANIGSQINAEGAGLIGKNGQVLGLPGKAISHAAVSALAAEIGGGDAKGAAAGALAAELAAITLDKTFSDPMKIQAGGKIIGSVAGAIATNSAKGANSGANAGEIVIVYNALAHLLSAAEKERQGAIQAYEEKKSAFCQQSPDTCKQAGNMISFGTDFVPVIGDIKGFVEAKSALDYLAAAIAIIPGTGDAAGKTIKAAEQALQKGNVGEVSKLLNKASDEIKALPKPGTTSIPSGGTGAGTVFKVDDAQLGKKLGKHVKDFGGNPSNPVDRKLVLDKIDEIGNNPDKTIPGVFAGQGTNGTRGDVLFKIKGNDVVVTKPNGTFVTIMKDGINNTSVKNALKGEPH
uniref:DUF637 domain-containing protein n=1 Tax=Photorhabdus antumapuensis TaxID=2862867 RepID=UPI001CED6F6C